MQIYAGGHLRWTQLTFSSISSNHDDDDDNEDDDDDDDDDKRLCLTNVSFQRRLNFCSRCCLLTYLPALPCTSDATLQDDDDGDDVLFQIINLVSIIFIIFNVMIIKIIMIITVIITMAIRGIFQIVNLAAS